MQLEAFAAYNSVYETISGIFGRWVIAALLTVLAALPLAALVGKCPGRARAQAFLLSAGLGLIVLGSYCFSTSDSSRLFALYSGGALLALYGLTWGFSELPSARPRLRGDVLACVIIAASTSLKLAYLQEWPLVLTDYAATTGATTIERYFYEGRPWHSVVSKAYLESGGASVLHAPLLALLFQYFDFTTFSVRCAEVVASVFSLMFLWLWLRISISPRWALVGLCLFAFSGEHLSQSRMGTFYSISQCVAIASLWLWMALSGSPRSRLPYAIGLLLVNLAVIGCYKPTQAVWILSIVMTILSLNRWWLSRKQTLITLCVGVLLSFALYYALYQPFLMELFPLRRPILATDTPIWQKNWSDEISTFIQPPGTILANLVRNAWRVIVTSAEYSPVKDAIFTPFSAIVMILASAGLLSRRWGLVSLFVIIGMLPSLTTFPLDRRSLLMRPMIPLCVMLLAHEWLSLCHSVIRWPTIRSTTRILAGFALVLLPFQGVYRLTRFNGPVGVGPSFGPEYVHEMIVHLQSISKEHSIVIMNPDLGIDKFYMAFARDIYLTSPASRRVRLAKIQPKDTANALPRTTAPTVYAVLNEENRAWVVPWLRVNIPTIKISAYKKDNRTIYWLGVVSQSPEVTQESSDALLPAPLR